MVYLTRKEKFNAAHRLFNAEWSDEKNFEVFGKCANPNWHGHNYTLEVTVKGDLQGTTGFITDARLLGQLINDRIVDKVDHQNLNIDVDFMKDLLPSTENFAIAIWKELQPHIKDCDLHCVKIIETDKISAEYFGE